MSDTGIKRLESEIDELRKKRSWYASQESMSSYMRERAVRLIDEDIAKLQEELDSLRLGDDQV